MADTDPTDVIAQSLTSAAADGRTIDRPEIAAAEALDALAAAGLLREDDHA